MMGKNEVEKLKMGNITQKWVDLLVPFSNDYSAKFSASELSRKAKIPQQTASQSGLGLIFLHCSPFPPV